MTVEAEIFLETHPHVQICTQATSVPYSHYNKSCSLKNSFVGPLSFVILYLSKKWKL